MRKLKRCRISGDEDLLPVLNLGNQCLTGVFPKDSNHTPTKGPLDLVWSPRSQLLQLGHTYNMDEMYGVNYGYRSGLNGSMVQHLKAKVNYLERCVPLNTNDIVLDIGSNDATLLNEYSRTDICKVGIDPTGRKFGKYYKNETSLIPEFFTESVYRQRCGNKNAKIITSIAMFYDLEDPNEFISEIVNILKHDGLWHCEMSYMPSMLRTNAYDTVCHEHLEYYSLTVVKHLLEDHDLRITDVWMNSVNGGSFAFNAVHKNSKIQANDTIIEWMVTQEEKMGIDTPGPFREFETRVFRHKVDLINLIKSLNEDGKRVLGYGASTKGNVLLQFCGFNSSDIQCIGEINSDKFGCVTPGSNIPIVNETEMHRQKPDYLLVLPWHFKNSIMNREINYLNRGGKLIFPLPEIEVI